jgi:capsular polysaccharide biosynthesis protein
MKTVRDEGQVLTREVESAQRAYESLMTRFNQTSLESQTTQSNVNVLTPASVPLAPSSPRIFLNTLVAVFLGTLLAVGAALGMELIDRRVRGVDDVSAAVGLPLLGVMPKPVTRGRFGQRQIPLMQQRLVTSLPSPARDN